MHQPGIEPGSVSWEDTSLPLAHWCSRLFLHTFFGTLRQSRFFVDATGPVDRRRRCAGKDSAGICTQFFSSLPPAHRCSRLFLHTFFGTLRKSRFFHGCDGSGRRQAKIDRRTRGSSNDCKSPPKNQDRDISVSRSNLLSRRVRVIGHYDVRRAGSVGRGVADGILTSDFDRNLSSIPSRPPLRHSRGARVATLKIKNLPRDFEQRVRH